MFWMIMFLGPVVCWALMRPAIGAELQVASELQVANELQVASTFIQPSNIIERKIQLPPKETEQAPEGSNVILLSSVPIQEQWHLNPRLSDACTKRRFRQAVQHHFVGIVQERVYGAAIGGHPSLVDEEELGTDKVVYLFKGQGTSDCRVYHRSI